MNYFIQGLKILLNIIIFMIYSFLGLTIVNYTYGFIMDVILDKVVPGSSDPIHLKLAILSVILVSVITLFFRKTFYITLKCNKIEAKKVKSSSKSEVKNDIKNEKEEDGKEKLDIYIDKEIK